MDQEALSRAQAPEPGSRRGRQVCWERSHPGEGKSDGDVGVWVLGEAGDRFGGSSQRGESVFLGVRRAGS